MEDKAGVPEQENEEIKRLAARRAGLKARDARWDLDIAVFLFGVLTIVIILLFQGIVVEVVGPVALFGLVMVWYVGWRRGKQLYQIFYEEELADLKKDLEKKEKPAGETIEETIEEKVQKALRERWQ
jgi:Flp pilus assembly protein TadB